MKEKVYIYLSGQENSAVQIAARNLAGDIEKVSECEVAFRDIEEMKDKAGDNIPQRGILIASMGICEQMREWFPRKLPDTGCLKEADGKARWEAFLHQLSEEVLYIIGSDKRGTVYGIYDLSEQIGISPWYFWADVPPKKEQNFSLPKGYYKVDWPSVPYRGIFLNDEEELEAWAKKHTGDNTIGPETYEKIYELILRMKGNYIWPAMHVNYFNENPENRRLAGEAGIVVGTSHCDMMMRSNQNEWRPWLAQKGYHDVKYDYSIPGENHRILQEYWTESVEMYRDYDASYTVGMRGIHDSGFVTETIDADERLTMEEKRREKVRLLGEVVSDQRRILKEVLGEEKGGSVPQIFIPYKEVLSLYDNGLELPEDVTLMWVDDNFGYVRRYPSQEERRRSGGHGLYYHASYWAPPGLSYLFINSIPLDHTGNELKKCWESGIRKMWVLNVGALKPLEMDMEFFIRYGWEAGKETGDTKDGLSFAEYWFDRNFSGGYGREAAQIYCQFAQVTNVCKLEHMQSDKFSQTAYGDEAQKRMLVLKDLLQRADCIYEKLPSEEKDAFYELLYMKVEASYLINASFYYADRSTLSYSRGAMQAADAYLALSRRMDSRKRQMLHYYNHKLQGGKWDGILTPESFLPPPTVLYPAAKPALVIGDPGLGLADAGEMIKFSYYGEREKCIEVYNKGCGTVSVQVSCPEWLETSVAAAEVSADLKIWFRVRNGFAHLWQTGADGDITICGSFGEEFHVPVRVQQQMPVESTELPARCYMEADGCVSMPADGFERQTDSMCEAWRVIPCIGRGEGSAVEAFAAPADKLSEGKRPVIEYVFYLQSEGAFLLEIYRFLTLNSTGRVRFGIGVDDMPFFPVESLTTDEWKGNWEDAVMNDGEKLYVRLPFLEKGVHRLRLQMIDNYVTLTKFVIYTDRMQSSNLGPSVSAILNAGECKQRGASVDFGNKDIFYEDIMKEVYERLEDEVPLLPMLYADPKFRTISRLYVRSDEREQTRLGRSKYHTDSDGRKNVFAEFPKGPFRECGGRIMIEAEYALADTKDAYLTPAFGNEGLLWSHTQAETNGGSGFAMMIEGRGLLWEDAAQAPGMHYRIHVGCPGKYYIWLLVKFEDMKSDACVLALDGRIQDRAQQYSGGNLFSYGMKQRWNWQAVSAMEITEGYHIFSIMGRKSGLRVDRIYITSGSEWPPIDFEWDSLQP